MGATVASVAGEWAARRWRRRAARRRRRRRGVRWSAERCGVRFSLTGRAEFYFRSPLPGECRDPGAIKLKCPKIITILQDLELKDYRTVENIAENVSNHSYLFEVSCLQSGPAGGARCGHISRKSSDVMILIESTPSSSRPHT